MIREITLKDFPEGSKEGLTYTGTNGYTGKLVPWVGYRGPQVALWIFGPDGKLTLHTANTPARTMDDLKEHVEGIEEFLDSLNRIKEDTTDDDI